MKKLLLMMTFSALLAGCGGEQMPVVVLPEIDTTNPLLTASPIKEVNASSIRTLERYNLKPYIIAGIFIVIIGSIILYFYFKNRNNRRKKYTLHF